MSPNSGSTVSMDHQQLQADYAISTLVDAIVDHSPLHELNFAINAVTDDDFVILRGDVDRPGAHKVHRCVQKKSVYRGVSMNGKKWQTMVMGNNKKFFSPSLRCEVLAARAYDRYLIQIMGLSAKTNFSYTRRDLILIVKDIQSDVQSMESDEQRGDLMRISFHHFKIQQTEIESAEDQMRLQSKPIRRNIPRFIK